MPTELRFDELDLREEPAADSGRTPLFGSSGVTATCTATKNCTHICCTCNPG